MAEQKSAEKPRRKWRVLQTLVILLVIIIAGFVVFRLVLKIKLHARLDAIRAEGYPATCAELDAWYTIPESAENAADIFIDSLSHFDKWEDGEKRKLLPVIGLARLPLRTEPLAEETKTLVTQYLADHQQALKLLHKGAVIEHCRYPLDLSKGFALPFIGIRRGARLLKLEAILDAENGKPEQAADSITSAFGLARSLSKEPFLISQLVRIACQELAVSTLERAVNRTEFSDEQLIELGGTLANAEDPCAMRRAFVGKRCEGLSVFKMPSAQILQMAMVDRGSFRLGAIPIALYKFAGLADRGAIIYIDLMSRYIEATKLPAHERVEAANAVNTKFEETSGIHVIPRIIMPAFSRVAIIDVRAAARLRTARAGLAVQRYRLAAGKLPDTLADLMPTYLDTVPKDPFDGKELRYKKLETGFVVYSIGKDGNDDGGKERPRKRTGPPASWDVTFIVQR
jgi:hypothetical protein